MKCKEELSGFNKTLFVCQCEDIHHQMVISFDDDPLFNDTIWIEIHLADIGFWKRLKYGIFYIFGQKSKLGHGAFAEILLDKEKTKNLIDTLTNHNSRMKS
jgi:hypothetical protein